MGTESKAKVGGATMAVLRTFLNNEGKLEMGLSGCTIKKAGISNTHTQQGTQGHSSPLQPDTSWITIQTGGAASHMLALFSHIGTSTQVWAGRRECAGLVPACLG